MNTLKIAQRILYIGSDTNVFNMLFGTLDEAIEIYHVNTPALGFAWLRGQSIAPALILIEKKQ